MNILICRLHPWMTEIIAKNLMSKGHRVHVIDHKQLKEYRAANLYASCHRWSSNKYDPNQKVFFQELLQEQKIDLVVIAQKLFYYSDIAENVCRRMGVRYLFTERFFDNKLIFDDVGLQYTRENQAKGESDLPIDWPKQDRELQPEDLTLQQLIDKYQLQGFEKLVVIYGQLPWDMSLVQSPENMPYDEYIKALCVNNPDTTFLFKNHPRGKRALSKFKNAKYPNLIFVNESLRTLFQLPAHTAFSSTVIFEGVSRGLKFASVGYHLLQGHTHRLMRGGFGDVYNKIVGRPLDMKAVARATSYITNIYTIRMDDPRLAERLIGGLNQEAMERQVSDRTRRKSSARLV